MILHSVYFSAKGTTRLCADCIAERLIWRRVRASRRNARPGGSRSCFISHLNIKKKGLAWRCREAEG